MSEVIGLVNYGVAGNIHSIKKALEAAGGNIEIVQDAQSLAKVDKIVLPGVGSFVDAMNELKKDGLIELLQRDIPKKPTLGICLGMQILSTVGFEFGRTDGLKIIDAEVKPIECNGPVPHMGFNSINIVNENSLLQGLGTEEFYFMHSYEMVNYTDISALTEYSGHTFVSSVKKDNIYGVQFHPEKSRDAGIELFKNFIRI